MNEINKCAICGCTENNACIHPDGNPCSWVDSDKNFCSRCQELNPDLIVINGTDPFQSEKWHNFINDLNKLYS